MNRKLLILGGIAVLVLIGIVSYFCYGRTSLKVNLTKSDITIDFKRGNLKLPKDEAVELHTTVLNSDEKEVLFFRNLIEDKNLKKFSWKGESLELEEGRYVIHSQLLKLTPLYTPELLFEKKQKIRL